MQESNEIWHIDEGSQDIQNNDLNLVAMGILVSRHIKSNS